MPKPNKGKSAHDHKRKGPQPYLGFHDACCRAEKTMGYLEALEKRLRNHRRGMRPKYVRALDKEIDAVLSRLTLTINQHRREIAAKLPAE